MSGQFRWIQRVMRSETELLAHFDGFSFGLGF